MNKLHFITDLDRTIIHSKNPDYRCVEFIGDKMITHMTDSSYEKLLNLLQSKQFNFVPCTMRSLAQTMRIDFIQMHPPKWLICTNGAQIYLNGQLDLEWEAYMRELIDEEAVRAEFLCVQQLGIDYVDLQCTEGFYLSMKFLSDEAAAAGCAQLKQQLETTNEILLVGRKVFVMDARINKVHAVRYLMNKFDLQHVMTAGDSEVDREFTKLGKAVLPQHASFHHEAASLTSARGILSTDEILDEVSACLMDLMKIYG